MTDQQNPQPITPPTARPAPPEGDRPRRRVKPWMWWAGGGGVAFVGLSVAAVVVGTMLVTGAGGGARSTAQQYLDAIAKGDAVSANRLGRVDTSDADNALATNAALAKATHITAVKIGRIQSSARSDRTYVDVAYKVGGRSFTDGIELNRDDKGWFVSEGLLHEIPNAPYDTSYRVAGSDRVIEDDEWDLVAYPAVYTVAAPSAYFTVTGDKTVLVSPDGARELDIELTPTDKLVREAQKQVDAHFDGCAKQTSYSGLDDCGIDLDYPDHVLSSSATAAVTVVEHPKVTGSKDGLSLDGGSFTAKISGPTYSGASGAEDVTGSLGYVSAGWQITDGKLVVTVD